MNLQEKVLQLKLEGAIAIRHAQWWEKQAKLHGWAKTEAFYSQKLGLNHIERKGVEFDGLQLSREPKEHEKIAVKGVAMAQESGKSQITSLLLGLRADLISDGLKGIATLSPANYHELVLQASSEHRRSLRDRLINIYRGGRRLVAAELGSMPKGFKHEDGCADRFIKNEIQSCQCEWKQEDEDFDELDELTDVTDARVANDVQARIIAAAARFTLLGLVGAALEAAIRTEIETGSVSYIDRTATGLANKTLAIGRADEMQERSGDIERYEYSALLDNNTCPPCAADDGRESASPDGLPSTPNPECDGSDFCRCFIVAIAA
jgi:hypothetical protein